MINGHLVPTADEAFRSYTEAGGTITEFSGFGQDPLAHDAHLSQQREAHFHDRYQDFGPFFQELVNGDDKRVCEGLLFFIQITQTLAI